MKIFLGGTCNGDPWRDQLMPMLDELNIDYFNPVVKDWTSACQEEEYRQKEICNIHLYVITKRMSSVFSIAEAVDSVHDDRCDLCLFVVLTEGFAVSDLKSLQAVANMIDLRDGVGLFVDNVDIIPDLIATYTDSNLTKRTADSLLNGNTKKQIKEGTSE